MVGRQKTEIDKGKKRTVVPLKLFGQEFTPETWAMANMNMIIHDMEGQIEIDDTFKNPKFRSKGKLRTFDRVVANPMWNQDWFTEADYDNDELDRFPAGAGFPGKSSADWGWVQHIHASLNATGRAAVVLDTGAASRGSGNAGTNKEKTVRQWFVDHDLIESVLYRLHTDAIQAHLIPAEVTTKQASITYANEADLLNVALFGQTAREWRDANPDKDGNMRDHATLEQLLVLANIENMNAEFIHMELPQGERLKRLNAIAIRQMRTLTARTVKQLEGGSP